MKKGYGVLDREQSWGPPLMKRRRRPDPDSIRLEAPKAAQGQERVRRRCAAAGKAAPSSVRDAQVCHVEGSDGVPRRQSAQWLLEDAAKGEKSPGKRPSQETLRQEEPEWLIG